MQSLSCVRLLATPWTSARQASLSITNSQSLFKLMSIESVMPSNHLILFHPLLLPPSIFPSIGLFQWVSSSHQVATVLEFQLQHQSFTIMFYCTPPFSHRATQAFLYFSKHSRFPPVSRPLQMFCFAERVSRNSMDLGHQDNPWYSRLYRCGCDTQHPSRVTSGGTRTHCQGECRARGWESQ